MRKKEIDAIDVQILRILASNSNVQNQELAEKIGLTASPTLRRVENLHEKGYIVRERAEVNYEKLGFKFKTVVMGFFIDEFADKILPQIEASTNVISLIVLSERKNDDLRLLLAYMVGKSAHALDEEIDRIFIKRYFAMFFTFKHQQYLRINEFLFKPEDIL